MVGLMDLEGRGGKGSVEIWRGREGRIWRDKLSLQIPYFDVIIRKGI